MSNSVDNRIVQMEFDNQRFEGNVRQSIKSLDDLKKGLKLEESARSLSNLDKVGRRFSLSSLTDAIQNVSNRFTNLGIVGITVIQNLTNTAVNAGKRIVSALTVDPIKTGLDEYETKMGAITTILTNTKSKGTTIYDVNEALAELNTYADRTIYNFAEMTRNIGTFTAAGVDLKTSTTSIKGIANLAAGSGSSALQASTAMYQLSQAIASGTVKLMDWNSVVNAGMGGEMFQKALEKTAKELGHGRDMSVSFRESLESGWITTEVLTKTLAKFANDESLIKAATQVSTFTKMVETMKESVQSGWAQTWELILGNKEESSKFFTDIYNGFSKITGATADARNEMLYFWKVNGGRNAMIQTLTNTLNGLNSILKPIKEAFTQIFPPITGSRILEITRYIRDLTANFKIGDETADKIKRTFAGLFAILDIGKMALSAIANGLISVLRYLLPVGNGFLSTTASIGDFFVALDKAIKSSNIFTVAINKVGNFMKPIADGVKKAIKVIISSFEAFRDADISGLETFSERVRARFEPFTKLGGFINTIFSKLVDIIKKIAPIFYALAGVIGGAFDKMRTNIVNALDNAEFESVFDIINGGMFAAILYGVKKFIDSLTKITNSAGGFVNSIKGILDGVKGSLEAYQSSIKAGTLLKIAIAIGILSASLMTLSMIDSQKLTVAMAAMTAMFVELFGSMAIFQKLMGTTGFVAMGKVTISMIGLSVAVLILSNAMAKLGKLDWAGVAKGLLAIAGITGILAGSTKLLEGGSKGLIKASLGFIVFGVAINILAVAVEKLGKLKLSEIGKGLIAIGVLAAELSLFMKATNLDGMGAMKGLGFLALAAAISVLADAVKKFTTIDGRALKQGLTGVGILLAEIAVFVNLTGDSKRVISTAIGLTILGAAMMIFARAINAMGSMSGEQIGKGLLTMAGSLAAITIALNLMPKNMILTGAGLVVVASALVILSNALTNMSGMSWDGIAKSLVTLAGSLTIIGVAMIFMSSALPGAAALLIIAGALAILAPVLKIFGSMSFAEIGKGLLMLVGIFTVLGLAGLVLAPLIPVILGLAAAVALLGVGCLAMGAGVLVFAMGLTALAAAGAAGTVALVALVTSLVSLIPFTAKTLAKGLVDFIRIIGESAPVIAKSVEAIILAIVEVLVKVIPVVVEAVYKLLTKLLDTMLEYEPKIIDTGMRLIIGFLRGVADHIEEVVATAIEVVINFIKGVASMIPKIIQAGVDLILSFINGIADAIEKNTDPVIDAVSHLISVIIDAVVKIFTKAKNKFIDTGKNIVTGLIEGVKSMISSLINTVGDMVNSVVDSAKNVLGIHSPSRVFKDEVGKMIGVGMANGIKDSTKDVTTASEKMSKGAYDAAKEWIDEKKYYNMISLEEELYVWQQVQKKLIKGSDELKQANRELYRVKMEVSKKEYDASINWIEDRKYYNKLSLSEELAAYKRMQTRYITGSEERKKIDKEIYRLNTEINSANEDYTNRSMSIQTAYNEKRKDMEDDYYRKTKEVNDKLVEDIKSVTKEYDDAVKSRADSLYSVYGLFDKVDTFESIDGYQLISNLEGQLSNFETWQNNLRQLKEKGIDDGLIKELEGLGPKSVAQIEALNRLSSEKLNQYVSLWKTKHNEVRTQAVSELISMQSETLEKIEELKTQAGLELTDYRSIWNQQLTTLNSETSTQLAALQTEWQNKVGSLTDNVQKIMKKPDWNSLGANIIDGITKGLKTKSPSLLSEMINIANLILTSFKKVLGINSPSKEFEKLGMYSNLGLVNGLKKYSDLSKNASKDVGESTKKSFIKAVSKIVDFTNDSFDMTPTIRPVLDLSDVISGKEKMNGLFANSPNMVISGATRSASIADEILTRTNVSVQNGSIDRLTAALTDMVKSNKTASGDSVTNEFNFSGGLVVREEADIEKIAVKLYDMQRRSGRSRGYVNG